MPYNELIASLLAALFIIYLILGLVAFANIKPDADAFLISFPLWFIRREIYNEVGKRLCPSGKVLFIFILVVSIIWTIFSIG